MFNGYKTLWYSGAALVVALLMYLTMGQYWTKLVVDVLLLGAAIIVSWTWGPAAIDAFKRGAKFAGDKVVLTVWFAWTALLIQRIYAIALTVVKTTHNGNADSLVNSPASIMIGVVILVAGAYAAYATVAEADVPLRERRHVLIATFVGGIAVGITLTLSLVFGFVF